MFKNAKSTKTSIEEPGYEKLLIHTLTFRSDYYWSDLTNIYRTILFVFPFRNY